MAGYRQAALAVLSLPILGCSFVEGRAWVYVDNGGSLPFEVSVDGAKPVTAPAGGAALFKLRAGTHRFLVRRGSEVLYDQSKTFADSQNVIKSVLNPDGGNRYLRKQVTYSSNAQAPQSPRSRSQVLRETFLLKPDPWIEGRFDLVLDESAPPEVKVRKGDRPPSPVRLCRVTVSDYDVLTAAKEQDKHGGSLDTGADALAVLERVLRACH